MTTPQEARSLVKRLEDGADDQGRGVVVEATTMLTEYADLLEQQALTDEEIVEIAQTMGRKVPGVSDYDSWPGMGYGTDTNGKHTIPSVPDIALRFARAIERRVRGAK